MTELKIGMKLFHRSKMGVIRNCELSGIHYEVEGYEMLDVKFSKKIKVRGKKVPTDTFRNISSKCIGEFLFFKKDHADYLIEDLANMPEYVKYGNEKILKFSDEIAKSKMIHEGIDQDIVEIIKNRNIKYLIYFTRIENLKSILQYGIVPQKQHSFMNIRATGNNSKKRYYFQVDGNGYSIEFPNYRLLNRLREDGDPTDRYVVLCLSAKDVLLNTIGEQVYCPDNALTNEKKYFEKNLEALFLEGYFKEGYVYDDEYHKEINVNRRDLRIPENYTTNPQAEIIICDIVEPKYIKKVVFESNVDKQKWLENNSEFQNQNVEFIVDNYFFGPRSDYEFWK